MRRGAQLWGLDVRGRHLTAGLALAALAAPGAALAQDDGWSFQVTPYIWPSSLDGDMDLAGFTTPVDVPFSETFENLDVAVSAEVEVMRGRWGVVIDGQYVETSQEQTLLGQPLGLGVTNAGATGAVFYRIYDSPQGGDTVSGEPRRFVVEPMVGVRWSKLKANVEALGRNVSKQADWTEPFVGVRSRLDLTDRWTLLGDAKVGGFDVDDKQSAEAEIIVGYRLSLLGQPSMIRAGYRVLHQEFESDDFTGQTFRWDVTQQGPIVGLTLEF